MRVVLAALMVAVATVATIALFASQLQRTLVTSASSFLAADRQLEAENGRPIPESWLEQATERGLETGRMVQFSTMVFGADNFQLVSVKAVSNEYPLRGDIEIQRNAQGPRELVKRGPAPGEVWINPRLLRLLELEVGDSLEVGSRSLTVSNGFSPGLSPAMNGRVCVTAKPSPGRWHAPNASCCSVAAWPCCSPPWPLQWRAGNTRYPSVIPWPCSRLLA